MNDHSEEELIENYLNKNLVEAEKINFETRLQNEPALREKLEDFQKLFEGFSEIQRQNLETELMDFEKELSKKEVQKSAKIIPFKVKSWRQIAVGIVLLMVSIYLFYDMSRPVEKLNFTKLYEPLESKIIRGETETANLLKEGLQAWALDDFDVALKKIAKIPQNAPEFMEAQFYLADTYFQLEMFLLAASSFQLVAASQDVRFSEQAEWNLIISKLKSGATEREIRPFLEKILENENHNYFDKAKDLEQDF